MFKLISLCSILSTPALKFVSTKSHNWDRFPMTFKFKRPVRSNRIKKIIVFLTVIEIINIFKRWLPEFEKLKVSAALYPGFIVLKGSKHSIFSKIGTFAISAKIQVAAKIWEIQHFLEALYLIKISSTQWVQNLLETTLMIFEINSIFYFHQTSRWRPKCGKFNIFQKHYI